MTPAVLTRFMAMVSKSDGCGYWLWKGSLKRCNGYGCFSVSGKILATHRVSWMLFNGEIPNGFHVLHHCDVRACVNPQHLFLGTNEDNIADMDRKRRRASSFNKLTEPQAIEVIAKLAAGERGVDLAREYSVSKKAIYRISSGARWPHLARPWLQTVDADNSRRAL